MFRFNQPSKESTRSLLVSRGVHPSLFAIKPFDIEDYLKVVAIPKSKDSFIERTRSLQVKDLIGVVRDPYKHRTIFIGSDNFIDRPEALAMFIMRHAIAKRGDKRLPYWHYIVGGFHDKLRDDEYTKNKIGRPGLLILDGLTVDSSEPKIEKAFDIIKNTDCPKIIVCGGNPVELAMNRLHVKPDMFFMFSETKSVDM